MKYNRTTTGIIKDIDLLKKTYFSTPELIGPIQLAILRPFFYNTYMYISVHPNDLTHVAFTLIIPGILGVTPVGLFDAQ